MDLKDYQDKARTTAIYPKEYNVVYPTLGLCGESGEVSEKIKKRIRDNEGNFTDVTFLYDISKELGDVLWYISNLASDLNLDLNAVAANNLHKLKTRQEQGVLEGDGDDREC
jgi:NTP pyrophosphatase (non-canonical NTP hydrolase)